MPSPVTVLPTDADLPGSGWLAIDEGFATDTAGGDVAEVFDCVGPEFPADDEVIATAATPHYLRPPGRLLHGFALSTRTDPAAVRAERILRGAPFAECLARSVAADIDAAEVDAELLAVDVEATGHGHRVRFTGGTATGVRPVQLDVICLRHGRAVGLLWFADTPDPFDPDDVAHVLAAIRRRAR